MACGATEGDVVDVVDSVDAELVDVAAQRPGDAVPRDVVTAHRARPPFLPGRRAPS